MDANNRNLAMPEPLPDDDVDAPAPDAYSYYEPGPIDWRDVALPGLPEPVGPLTLEITSTELWCSACGSDGADHPRDSIYNRNARPACWRCGSTTVINAAELLDRLGVAYRLR